MNKMKEADDQVCCNSGCNNCVLDTYQRHVKLRSVNDLKYNLFDGTYRQFKVIFNEKCTEIVNKIRFEFVSKETNEDKYTIQVPPTYHLFIRTPIDAVNTSKNDKNTKENYIGRPYTPIKFEDFSFEILVKFETNGKMSNYLKNLKIDDLTEWKGCYGNFLWSPNPFKYKYLVCICQGVAIAPMISLISSILSNEEDETLIYLLVCFKNMENYLLRTELVEYRKYWNFRPTVYLSQFAHNEECTNRMIKNCACIRPLLRYDEIVCPYRLDKNELQEFYNKLTSNLIFTLFCGTNNLENLIQTCNIHKMGNYFALK